MSTDGADGAQTQKPRRRYSTKLSHPTYVIEACPNCEFPEADGGHCEECGWTRYSENCPHCLKARR